MDSSPADDTAWIKLVPNASKPTKQLVSLRIDADVLEFYRGTGKGYQTLINSVLKAYVNSRR